MKVLIAQLILYGSYVVFPLVVFLLLYLKRCNRIIIIILLLLSSAFIWSRFIERNLITVTHTEISVGFNADVILIADTHLGVYKDEVFLERVVQRVNELPAEAVLFAGDFTYEPNAGELDTLLAPLSQINKPVYAVLGNHDVQKPGPDLRAELVSALEKHGVLLLSNDEVRFGEITLLGLGSHWANEDEVQLLEQYQSQDNLVVLTHNPDTTSLFTTDTADITLTGHTHCGQIRIPWWYKQQIPTRGDFDRGLTKEDQTQLFITCGLGEVGLPMRLFNPPVIDVIHLR